jgi:SAM-dependent methyltransferase
MTPDEYWRRNKRLQHITPPGVAMPEVGLADALKVACQGSVFEFGCGYGRLASTFTPDGYVGYDINPAALQEARRRNPQHRFADDWQHADTFLAHTVLLHIPDDQIKAVLDRANLYRRVVIGEIMGRKWRRPGDPPVFNREAEEYEALMGCKAVKYRVPYPRYKTDLILLAFNP